MTVINATSGAYASNQIQWATGPNGGLGSMDFMRLMIAELQNQDPMNPMKNEDLLAQVSAIKNVETLTNLDATLTGMTYQQTLSTASSLIGKGVTGLDRNGREVEGVVRKVIADWYGVTLITDKGDEVGLDSVTSIVEAQ